MTPTDLKHWDDLDRNKFRDERAVVAELLANPGLTQAERADVLADAIGLVDQARASQKKQGVVESFLQEFSLGTREGLALMCLAEALLRTPDADTRDRLIAEKIGSADWASHMGQSDSLFVNASTWGLMLTGKLVDVDDEAKTDLSGFLKRIAGRLGEPVIRQAVATAVKIMGEQFVVGRTIEAALKRSDREGWLCSFDMLGEGARTVADAERYEKIYADAIEAVGKTAKGQGPEAGHGVSVKLSALSPRYQAVQEDRVWEELYPRILRLALIAAKYDINYTIDAEEADRLALSLKLLERLAREPELGDWKGLGLAVQAYQKRTTETVAKLAELAKSSGRRLMVRLVKGAYWDTEIKLAQVNGRTDYPVFTTKPATDLNYLVCAKALIEASPYIYAQFATHNAHTLAAVRRMARDRNVTIEHQRLHGMGEALYDAAHEAWADETVIVRAYAPVGGHEELLPYLVRRLLENGANSSFVHALLDERVPAAAVAADPITAVEAQPDRHPRIPVPMNIYGDRQNSLGRDYSQAADRERHAKALERVDSEKLTSGPIIGGKLKAGVNPQDVTNPFDRSQVLGHVSEASVEDVDAAVNAAGKAQVAWDRIGGAGRAPVLRAMADALEADMDRLVALLSREAGKTLNDGVAEVREAADFCRYYALLAERDFGGRQTLKGPTGETNELVLHGRGVFAAISPWNFPLAIFAGQIAAALAAGNAVVAKPAEQTPLIAAEAVRLFYKAGLNPDLLALVPGRGEIVGAALTNHPGIDGVAFTGGTDTAAAINRGLAARPGAIIPFIAETGGLNAMFVDTTALKEQVIDDVILSAFGSAGQRCSALRVLYAPKEAADALIEGLKGALATQVLGDPTDTKSDIGPVIDAESRANLEAHVERLSKDARIVARAELPAGSDRGDLFAPTIAEIPTPDFLEREVFGPILHVYRYDSKDLKSVAAKLAARGYGLTLGVHSRIEAFADEVVRLVPAGNVYVNRSIIGAVVGVQPFGGEGLSGTGPKAGGPNSLIRYAAEKAISVNIAAQGGDPALLNL
ncbi:MULTISPECIES: bifunctional proline dehydrogenase/L-glutamate gamma-semialdehyde dehydrogenase PutA [unclassified Brevundimonas]|uniref:bifunctional proline dehydrogenase/L-glutamate gamma-semialdehyde dehydrogenase PutA n=1 Tax=unclassified Brevundimonas TaxID=2622653 RepID=UPI000CFB5F89|nr:MULTISPECIES: bifunctional proline dehydrogenase/L-glutamate gamma-semialdehyde dehydrogenase PutA [unclassified Brevundimonas]PRA25903.1 bifunctional proline dehydrogenase/L-glutamate gamma-semialdehyde dehydrogenase [Brevundimonas sp. MYb27]PQZ75465.1 bifunctional proline dehydrogenase/L-glutamate gamma-semialdehyde dehydrogenase [Brevundimonas sp. MYb31]PRB11354.1 bifunctional proline dehydrogenase/L-glutamate gamma-semialdehyde dehydrogenase [Brevundimonas sp. MYb52]PRB32588.1 bifunction